MLTLAIDLGGSHVTAALVRDDRILAHRAIPAGGQSFEDLLSPMETMVDALLHGAGTTLATCEGIAFGFPGAVDCWAGRVLATNQKYEDAREFDFAGWARRKFGCRLVLENDARLALLGEHHCGAARGASDAAMVVLGTGIGTGVILGDKPLRGHTNQAGSLGGHLPVRLNGRRCTCGGTGCAEAEASTWALPMVCREWADFADSPLAGLKMIDFRGLFEAMDGGDSIAQEVFRHCVDIWTALAVALTHAYSPQVIVFGGGVMARAADILPAVAARVVKEMWSPGGSVEIRASALGSSAALHGAIPLLREFTA